MVFQKKQELGDGDSAFYEFRFRFNLKISIHTKCCLEIMVMKSA